MAHLAADRRIQPAVLAVPAVVPAAERDELIIALRAMRDGEREIAPREIEGAVIRAPRAGSDARIKMPTTLDKAGRLVILCIACGEPIYADGARSIHVMWERLVERGVILGATVRERWHIPPEGSAERCTPNWGKVSQRFDVSREAPCCAGCIAKAPSKRYLIPSKRRHPSLRYAIIRDQQGNAVLFLPDGPAYGG